MNAPLRRSLLALLHGTTLATIFFYPLLQVLNGDIYYLSWQWRDTVEFAMAFALLSVVFAVAWAGIERLGSPRWQLVCIFALAFLPVAAFLVTLLRQLPIKEELVPLLSRRTAFLATAAGLSALGIGCLLKWPSLALAFAKRSLQVLSPVSLVVVFTLGNLADYRSYPTAESRPTQAGQAQVAPSVFVFLFDELSFRFMYKDGRVREDLPNLRRLAESATGYLAAEAPGSETITSVPGLLAARRFHDVDIKNDEIFEILPDNRRVPLDVQQADGLFAMARAAGLRTEAIGYFFPYCRLLSGVVDQCWSSSFYNRANTTDGFSLLSPVLTNLTMWPYQFPFGLLKTPAFVSLQRRTVERTLAEATSGLTPAAPRFRFVHFSVPHLPFAYGRLGVQEADDPMRTDARNYENAIEYVDTITGTLVDALKRAGVFDTSTIVVLSDHEFRWPQLVPAEAAHIPLIVKKPGQSSPEVVTTPVRAEEILRDLFSKQ